MELMVYSNKSCSTVVVKTLLALTKEGYMGLPLEDLVFGELDPVFIK